MRGRTRARCSTPSPPRSSTRRRSVACSSACCCSAGVNPTLANLTQAILYALTTRLGAPGRDRYLLVLTLGIGLLGGWLTVATGGIAAAFLGHAITRFAVFLCTGHTGQTKPRGARGRGDREAPATARGLARHRLAGVALPGIADRWVRAGGRRSRSTSTSRSASRSARTATSWSRRRRRARPEGADRRVPRGARTSSSSSAPTRSTRRSAGRPPAARVGLPRRRHAVAPAGRRRSARCSTGSARGSASPPAPRSRSRRTPGPTSAATRPSSAPPASRGCRSARRSIVAAELRRLGRRHRVVRRRRRRRRGARGRDRLGQPRPAVRRPGRDAGRLDRDARAALALEPDHLSLYALTLDDPDAEGLTGPGGDHLPTTARRAPLARASARPRQDEDRAAAEYHHAVHRLAGGRLARLRDQQLGAAGPREPAQPRLLAAPAVRGGRAGRPRLRRRDAALERRPARRLPRGADAAGDGAPRLPPGGSETLDAGDRGGRGRDPRPAHGRGVPIAAAHEPPLADAVRLGAGGRAASTSTPDDRVVLTTRGRLLSNELFARLV